MTFGKYLRELRGNRSLREIERISGVSHTYIKTLESGVDPRSGNEIIPTSDSLRKLAMAYNILFVDLMIKSGNLTYEEVRLWAHMNLDSISRCYGKPRE